MKPIGDSEMKLASVVRREFGENDAKRDAGLTTPANVKRFDDIIYGTNDMEWQRLDVYRPKEETGTLPVILNVHGGGWVYGSKEIYQFYCMSLAEHGYAAVNFSYRLAPENRYPSSFEDLNTVCAWVYEHATEYGFDTDHVFAVGDSAGAHMLALYAAALTNAAYGKQCGYALQKKLSFTALALNCGVYDLDHTERTLRNMVHMLRGDSTEDALLNPVLHITDSFPPSFVMTAVGDFLIEQPDYLIPVLQEKKVPHVFKCYGSEDAPLGHVFHANVRLKEAGICNEEEMEFFRSFLK